MVVGSRFYSASAWEMCVDSCWPKFGAQPTDRHGKLECLNMDMYYTKLGRRGCRSLHRIISIRKKSRTNTSDTTSETEQEPSGLHLVSPTRKVKISHNRRIHHCRVRAHLLLLRDSSSRGRCGWERILHRTASSVPLLLRDHR